MSTPAPLSSPPQHASRGWVLVLAAAVLLVVVAGVRHQRMGFESMWGPWKFAVLLPPFFDTAMTSGAVDSLRLGLDPMIDNPGDPIDRPHSYPRVWYHTFALLGLDYSRNAVAGLGFAALYLAGVMLIARRTDWTAGLVLAALVWSPASVMGMHQGNTDLPVFFAVCLAIQLLPALPLAACLLFFTGFVFKIFPLFGLAALVGKAPRVALRLGLLVALVTAVYGAMVLPDLVRVRANTPNGGAGAFGAGVIWTRAGQLGLDPSKIRLGRAAGYGLIAAALVAFGVGRVRGRLPRFPAGDELHEAGFRAGAAIYIGVFLIGNNWDYRLIYLIPAVPLLVTLARVRARGLAWPARFALGSIVLSFSYAWIRAALEGSVPGGRFIAYGLDEAVNWGLLLSLVYLLWASIPDWVMQPRAWVEAFKRGAVPGS